MQSNIAALLETGDAKEQEVDEALDQVPTVDLGAIVQRLNDLEAKVNELVRQTEDNQETPAPPNDEDASEQAAEEEKDAMTETSETIEESEETNNDG